MCDYGGLKNGKRENQYTMKPHMIDEDKIGVPSPYNEQFYIYLWDERLQKHVAKLVKRNEFDTLG